MGKFFAALLLAVISSAGLVQAETWDVDSPDQNQTFAYGSERSRQWFTQGGHLALAIHFTNDPYVDTVNFRQYDDFVFNFPSLTLGKDGKTFFYHPAQSRPIPVAVKRGLLGTSLLPSSYLIVRKMHGLVTLTLVVSDSPHVSPDGD